VIVRLNPECDRPTDRPMLPLAGDKAECTIRYWTEGNEGAGREGVVGGLSIRVHECCATVHKAPCVCYSTTMITRNARLLLLMLFFCVRNVVQHSILAKKAIGRLNRRGLYRPYLLYVCTANKIAVG